MTLALRWQLEIQITVNSGTNEADLLDGAYREFSHALPIMGILTTPKYVLNLDYEIENLLVRVFMKVGVVESGYLKKEFLYEPSLLVRISEMPSETKRIPC